MTSPFNQHKCLDSRLLPRPLPARHVLKSFGERDDAVRALFPSWVRMFDVIIITAACWLPRTHEFIQIYLYINQKLAMSTHAGFADGMLGPPRLLTSGYLCLRIPGWVGRPDPLAFLYTILAMRDILESSITFLAHPCPNVLSLYNSIILTSCCLLLPKSSPLILFEPI